MPELSELTRALHEVAGRADWEPAGTLRGRADRRTRRARAAAVLATVVALALAGAGVAAVAHGRVPASTPPAGPTRVPVGPPPGPTLQPTPSPGSSPGSSTVSAPPRAVSAHLLTPKEVGPGYSLIGTGDGVFSPNPFATCGVDGFPHDADVVAASYSGMAGRETGTRFDQSVLALRPGVAPRLVSAVAALPAGVCRGHLVVVAQGAGDVVLRDLDAQPGAAGPVRRTRWIALVRAGDRVAWVELVDRADRTGLDTRTLALARLLAGRMCDPAC
jgi:hypothetical protein